MIATHRILAAALLFGVMAACSKDHEPPKAPPPAGSTSAASGPPGTLGSPASPGAPATPGARATAPVKPNLVLITMEATRADHLGAYEDSLAKTPALDELAREGVTFSKAFAVAPLTLPSHASLFTGCYPPRHGVRVNGGAKLKDSETTLAEHLKAQGYLTAASIGTQLLAGDSGFRQGFDFYAEPKRVTRNAAFVVDDAIDAINRMQGGPFFLWVQLNDPAAPYAPPPGFRAAFENRLYDGEIAWMDVQLKRLFDHLRTQGLYDRTVVVATADHGESLGEHGELTHGVFVYESTLKVPWIMRYPHRILPRAKFTGLVSGVDLAPTVLELMGLPPLPYVQGESCVARLAGGNAPEREAIYAESLFGERAFGWAPLHALRTADEKFIDAPNAELYQLKRDPAETINLAMDQPKAVSDSWRPSLAEARRAIGGEDADGTAGRTHAKPGRDPKPLIAAANAFLKAQSAVEEGQPEQAVTLLKESLAKDPGNPAAKSLLSALRAEPAATTGAAANTFAAQWNQGNALYVHGQLDAAAKAFRAALALKPDSVETHYALGNVLAAKGDLVGAEAELRTVVTADPKMTDGWNKLGIVLQRADRRPEALAAYSRALEVSPDDADALFNRAKLKLLENDLKAARRDVDQLLAKHKDYAAAEFLEAHLCMAEGNSAGAKDALTKFLAQPQTDPRMKAAATDMLQKLGG
jgi:arylsulfatase A-like enzyme/Flp pilus assembly protein TadD